MRFTLIIPGEVQVDIRLFVSLKSEESLKWNVKSVFDQLFPTDRAQLVRHIVPASSGIFSHLIRSEITVMTFLAIVMRGQRIHLRNSGHGRHKRGPYGTTGTNQISVFV